MTGLTSQTMSLRSSSSLSSMQLQSSSSSSSLRQFGAGIGAGVGVSVGGGVRSSLFSPSSQREHLSSTQLGTRGQRRQELLPHTHKQTTIPSLLPGRSAAGSTSTKTNLSSPLFSGGLSGNLGSRLSSQLSGRFGGGLGSGVSKSTRTTHPSLLSSTPLAKTSSKSQTLTTAGAFSGCLLSSSRNLLSSKAGQGLTSSSTEETDSNREGEKRLVTIPTAVQPVTKRTEGAPVYNFVSNESKIARGPRFLPPELDINVQGSPAPIADVVCLKTALINAVATSLLCNPDFRSSSDRTRRSLVKLSKQVSHCDPEFILKMALYTRCDLNIRTTANFLLALASNLPSCRPYLRKYYCSSIRLPSDWIEVAEIYQAFHDKTINARSLPTALRKVMEAKFVEFDAYQLGKYNKDSSKSKKKKKKAEERQKGGLNGKGKAAGKSIFLFGKDLSTLPPPPKSDSSSESEGGSSDESVEGASDSDTEEEAVRLSFTLKHLIRKIHIREPVEPVMCLLGKRYPEDPEAFRRSRLPGIWDQDRAGKRMKLATPETWETQVSTKGNKAPTWEELIDHNKLPFMAMLRNLRNLIIAEISAKHHRWVLGKLNNERAVVNSRQFPFRFFSAYEVLVELEKVSKGESEHQNPIRGMKRSWGMKKSKKYKPPKKLPKIDLGLLQRYRSALDNALKIATCYNVKPISGSTVILCNVGASMFRPCTSARGLGKPRSVQEVGILLGLMCKYSCEDCTLLLYGREKYSPVQLKEGTILHNMEHVITTALTEGLTVTDGVIPTKFLQNMLVDRTPMDNIVLLTDAMKLDDPQGEKMMDFLRKYRQLVNPNLLFVSVDLSRPSSGLSSTIKPEHENDIYLAGYSDQILRFIAERGDAGQLTYVENIDKAHNLKEVKRPALLTDTDPLQLSSLGAEKALIASAQRQKWRTVRVFISSTFRDMHGERDLLTRFVFPELRARARSKQIELYEVDLRWGVTEEDARHHRALEICLEEIMRCQYFMGLLGERYGWIQDEYQVSDAPEFDWLKEFPARRSITEVEIHHACLCNPDKVQGKAFFYFRDGSVVPKIPAQYRSNFESESEEAQEKSERLKSEIRSSGLEVYDGYPSTWLGVLEEKPMVGGLEEFGQRVLYNLWNAIQRDYPDDETGLDAIAEATAAHNAFAESCASSFVGRRSLLTKTQELVESGEQRLVVLLGKPGSGKSAFMAALAQNCSKSFKRKSPDFIFTHFLGAAPSSTNLGSILTRLCQEMLRRFHLDTNVPHDITELVQQWPQLAEDSVTVAGVGSRLVLFLDGLDLLEEQHNARALNWIPSDLPQEVVIVVSVGDGGPILANLRKRQPPPAELMIGTLNEWDKGEMVRRTLARHRKTLDESAFNNQLKLLLSKRDATNPLFLHMACEELRVFGVFEKVSTFLKNLPTTLPNLLQEVLTRIEGEIGEEMIAVALSLLCLVRNGLTEGELSGVISLYFSRKHSTTDYETVLPSMVTARLLRCLKTFLQPTSQDQSDILSLAHKEVEKAVRSRYMKGSAGDKEKKYHHLLSNYFRNQTDPSGGSLFKGNDVRSFNELPYHLLCAGDWKELEAVVCNIHFVVAKCQLGSAQGLMDDYSPSAACQPSGKARELSKFANQPRVLAFRSFISRNLHVLMATPSLAVQQAINEPITSSIAQEAERALEEMPHPLIRWLNRPGEVSPCRLTISGHTSEVTCVAISQDSSHFAAGFKNCSVKVYHTSTGKEVQSFIGHAASITSLCFVGSHAICSGSHDTTLSLWDIKGGFRIAILKEHTRSVRGCAANSSGKIIVSVSWDSSTKVWDGRNGKALSTLKAGGTSNSPINCITFHPEGQLVAVGSWDRSIKIWDTFNHKRIKTMRGHKTSIQACAYAPSGRHIVSAALDGEVKIWSTKSGSAVGSIVGHQEPVNSLAFTPNGQYLITGSSDQSLKVWSGTLGQQVMSLRPTDSGYAHCMDYNRMNQTILVGYHDGHARKMNTQTGAEVFAVKLHSAAVVAVGSQGSFHMTASADGTIKVWVGPRTLPLHMVLEGHKAPITCATWSKKGFASAAEDFSLLLWPHEVSYYTRLIKQTKKQRPTAISVYPVMSFKGHTATISSIAFSLDGIKMASASHDQSVAVWDVLQKKEIRTLHSCHKDWINTCAFSDTNSNLLITGSNDFNLKLWDVSTGVERITFKGHTSSITSVAFSQGCVVSSAFDGSVKVWTRKGVEITTLYCHQQQINECIIDIPGKPGSSKSADWADMMDDAEEEEINKKIQLSEVLVLTASDDGTVGIWKPFVPNEIRSLVGHSDRALSVTSTLNNEIISCSRDKSIRLWTPQLTDSISLANQVKGHIGEVTSCTVSPDGKYIATSGRDGCFIVWSVKREGGEGTHLQQLYHVKDFEEALTSITFSFPPSEPGTASLAVGTSGGSVTLYQFSENSYPIKYHSLEPVFLMGEHPISRLALVLDGKQMLAASWSTKVATISGSNRKMRETMTTHSEWVMDVMTTKEAGEVVGYSIGLDRLLCRWLPTSQRVARQPLSKVQAVKFSIPEENQGKGRGKGSRTWLLTLCAVNHTYLAIGNSHGGIILWNRQNRKVELVKQVHQKAIKRVAAVNDDLVTASEDGTIKIWHVWSVPGRKPPTLTQVGHFYCQSSVTSLTTFSSPSGSDEASLLVAGDSLGHVMLLEWRR